MTKAYFDEIGDTDFSDSYDRFDFEEYFQEHNHARRNRKVMLRRELDRRMDMRRLKEMMDEYDSDDFD